MGDEYRLHFEELRHGREETGLELEGKAHSHFQVAGMLTIRGTGRWGKPQDGSPQSCQRLLPPASNCTSSAATAAICTPLGVGTSQPAC